MSDGAVKPRIARIWRGRVPAAKADEYARYNYEAGIKPLEEKALGVQSLREDRGETEFITISYWEALRRWRVSPVATQGRSTISTAIPNS